jgi:hypothetical protein
MRQLCNEFIRRISEAILRGLWNFFAGVISNVTIVLYL